MICFLYGQPSSTAILQAPDSALNRLHQWAFGITLGDMNPQLPEFALMLRDRSV